LNAIVIQKQVIIAGAAVQIKAPTEQHLMMRLRGFKGLKLTKNKLYKTTFRSQRFEK
jgi:hypothetical protein